MKPSDERTPEHVLDVVRAFDRIALDPCTTDANPAKAIIAYTIADNGLACGWTKWTGVVYVNPPYSRGQLPLWIEKCVRESLSGSEVIALIPSDLCSKAGALAASTADALCFVRGRLAFGSPAGQLEQGAKQPSVLVYWGDRAKRFERVFSQLGVVWTR